MAINTNLRTFGASTERRPQIATSSARLVSGARPAKTPPQLTSGPRGNVFDAGDAAAPPVDDRMRDEPVVVDCNCPAPAACECPEPAPCDCQGAAEPDAAALEDVRRRRFRRRLLLGGLGAALGAGGGAAFDRRRRGRGALVGSLLGGALGVAAEYAFRKGPDKNVEV